MSSILTSLIYECFNVTSNQIVVSLQTRIKQRISSSQQYFYFFFIKHKIWWETVHMKYLRKKLIHIWLCKADIKEQHFSEVVEVVIKHARSLRFGIKENLT